MLKRAGYFDGPYSGEYDAATRRAMRALVGTENFEQRFDEEKGLISSQVMEILQRKFAG
jgi:hypothetical protein